MPVACVLSECERRGLGGGGGGEEGWGGGEVWGPEAMLGVGGGGGVGVSKYMYTCLIFHHSVSDTL